MCTIAAVVGTDSSTVAKVINATGQSDDALAAAFGLGDAWGREQLQGVINRMIDLMTRMFAHLGRPMKGYQFGVPGQYKTLLEIREYMKSKKSGSRFAVWGCLNVMPGAGAHWNFATTMGDDKRVEFRDYQDNTNAQSPPAVSDAFLAPNDVRNRSHEYTSFIVLSFEPA